VIRFSPVAALPVIAALLLAACSSTPPAPEAPDREQDRGPATAPDLSGLRDPEPRDEPRSRYGNPETYEVFGRTYRVMANMPEEHIEEGIASWYGKKFHGRRTSSGETYDMYELTAAHRELPIPVYARVTHLENGRSVIVRINDRGPFARNRVIDLSYAAAHRLDMVDSGTAPVRIEVLRDNSDPAAEPDVARADVEQPRNDEPSATAVAARRLPGKVTVDSPTRYFVQVGAFSSNDNARRIQRELQNADFGPVKIDDSSTDTRLYRVRVGPVNTVEEVDRLTRRLREHGLDANRVVINP
jgi:rare lipoprotein A